MWSGFKMRVTINKRIKDFYREVDLNLIRNRWMTLAFIQV